MAKRPDSPLGDSRLTLAGRTFAAIGGRGTAPRGSYVVHGGSFYPVTGNDYPLRVLADHAADKPGQTVLIPATDGFVGMLSGTDRIIPLRRDEMGPEGFHRAVLRLLLSSSTREIVALGPVDNLAVTIKSTNMLALPPVINPRKTWRTLTILGGLLMLSAITVGVLGTHAKGAVQRAQQQLATQSMELDTLLAEVKTIRAASAKAKLSHTPESLLQPAALPDNAVSFSQAIAAAHFYTQPIVVKNGSLQN